MARVETESCETCGRERGERHKAIGKAPSVAQMQHWMNDGAAKATDGCRVEADGSCEHGHTSWMVWMEMI